MTEADLTTKNLETFSTPAAAWIKVILGSLFLAFGVVTLGFFFRARHVFEIRQRSAYLVSLLGASLLTYQGLLVELHYVAISHTRENFYRHNMRYAGNRAGDTYCYTFIGEIFRKALYVAMFVISASYVSRVVRLVVAYHDRLRHAVPWLMSERFLVCSSVAVGAFSLTIPLYTRFSTPSGDDYLERFAKIQEEHIWKCTVALQVVKCALLPVVCMVDDIFKIRRELVVIVFLGILQSVLAKLAHARRLGETLELWINPVNVGMLSTAIVFCLSVADPVRRVLFHPLSDYPVPIGARAKIMHSDGRTTVSEISETDSDDDAPTHETKCPPEKWNYEKIAKDPKVADAFRAFAHRALCQESVSFLEEVTRYRNGDFTVSAPCGGGQTVAFEYIARRFIMDGSADEINISHKDKNAILDVLHVFLDGSKHPPSEAEMRAIFSNAYYEIRYVLEANILHLFTETEEFRAALNPTETVTPSCKRCCCVV